MNNIFKSNMLQFVLEVQHCLAVDIHMGNINTMIFLRQTLTH